MKTRTSLGALFAVLILGTSLLGACSSDSEPNPADGNTPPATEDSGTDASAPGLDASDPEDAGTDAEPAKDASDSDAGDSGSNDTDAEADASDPDAHTDGGDEPGDADVDGGDDPGDASADASVPDDSGAEAGLPDAAPELPKVTCAYQSSDGAYGFSRSANKQVLTPGGNIHLGRYTLTRMWSGGSGTVQGTATVFVEGSDIFLRTYQLEAGAQAKHQTMWMQAKADGSLTLTELCDFGRVGEVATGVFEMRVPIGSDPQLWIELDGGSQRRYTLNQD